MRHRHAYGSAQSACLTPLRVALLASLTISGIVFTAAQAQQKSNFVGDYAGMLGPLHVKVHVIAASDGKLSCTVDSPDQGMVGLPCADFQVNGQAVSFKVPSVGGTYSGLISGDGSSVSGMWSQGTPTPLTVTRASATSTASASAPAPALPAMPKAEVKWDDYTYKFTLTGTMAQVFQNGKVVGSILTMNGDQRILPLPGTDSEKMTKSFEDYKAFYARGHSADTASTSAGSAAAPATQPAAPATAAATTMPGRPTSSYTADPSPTPAASIRFDDATKSIVVPRPDGITVTFVGEDVKIDGFRKLNYIVRHQKGTAGRFFERSLAHSDSAGGSLSGGGEEFLREGGGIIYDSGMGTNQDMQVNSPVLTAKQLSKIAVDAVTDIRQVPGHENFTPPGYNTLKEISQYRLRSDGSR
jgi:hypothetical protein